MSNLQLIEALCGLVENLVRIVTALATKLEQVNALDAAERREVDDALAKFSDILGADEVPDNIMEDVKMKKVFEEPVAEIFPAGPDVLRPEEGYDDHPA